MGPAEVDIAAIVRASGFPVVADIDLPEVAALCRMARVFIGNDSGVSHLAAAAGAPGVVIFGPTDPMRWRPLGDVTVLKRTSIETLGVEEVGLAVEQKIGEIASRAD
jgi:ADP-heptose:LPS heptosyltransferase